MAQLLTSHKARRAKYTAWGDCSLFPSKELCPMAQHSRALTRKLRFFRLRSKQGMVVIKTIIFDLGNVLVFFDHDLMMEQIARVCELPFADVFDLLMTQGVGIQFEQGLISTPEIYDLLKKKADKHVGDKELFQAIGDIFRMNDPMLGLVKELKANGYKLILLSNTCEIHIETIKEKYRVIHEFERQVLSYEVNARKPDPRIYLEALKLSGDKPEECLYIDDINEYVEAAKKLGLEGEHFVGHDDIVLKLKARGLL